MNRERSFTPITPFLYVCSESTIRQLDPKLFANIQCVINVADELPCISFPAPCRIQSWKYPIRDALNFPANCYFDTVADRIAQNVRANRRTVIYCRQGRSRSITFILAYLIKYHRLPLATAYRLVQYQRQDARPNLGFWQQLKRYDLLQRYERKRKFGGHFQKIKMICR